VSATRKFPSIEKVSGAKPPDPLDQSENDFSLSLGGPLYQMYLRTRLARPALDLVLRRVVSISLICWLPLLLLSLLAGRFLGGVSVPFLSDLEVHIKFLAVLPLLIAAELTVHRRLKVIVGQFFTRNIISPEDRSRFEEISDSIMHLRNSAVLEVILLLVAYSVAHWVWRTHVSLRTPTWYASPVGTETYFTAAGYWYAFVSMPLLRFIIFRWYFRLFLWYRFLWKVRSLPLHLNLFHPDRAGGLGFLTASIFAFSPVLVAQTLLLSGFIADRIWHAGANLLDFKMDILGVVVFLMLVVLTPLSFFLMHLLFAQRTAHREYGILASRYVDDFRRKWIQHPETDPLLGTSDIQSLADLGNAHDVISEMRLLPFNKRAVIRLAVLLIVPLLPLLLTIMPLDQIIGRLLKLAF
jgi:hypothetical protein